MPSFVLFLCQLSTITHNMRYSLTFLVTHSTKCCFVYLVFHIVCSQCLFLSHTQQGFHLNFQVSFSQPFPCVYFISCFWHILYKLSTHPCAFAKFFLFPHPGLSEFLLIQCFIIFYSFIPCTAFTLSINGSTELLTYHPKLFSSVLIHPSQLINPCPLIYVLRYILSTSFFE